MTDLHLIRVADKSGIKEDYVSKENHGTRPSLKTRMKAS